MSFHCSLFQLQQILKALPKNFTKVDEIKSVTGMSTDSRQLQAGEVFLALRGGQFDGHTFLPQAQEKGAIALIVDQFAPEEEEIQIPQFKVAHTLTAYQKLGHWWREQFAIPIIGITGSVGKTTTKELISAMLGTQGSVLKTQKNYNNEIGVPKTLLGLSAEHDYAVIEMAMRAKGEIAQLTQIACPTIGVITNVGTAHIGRLGSELAIAQAKCELLAELEPESSVAILNHDNALLMETAQTVWQGKTITYGLEGGDIQGKMLNPHQIEVKGTVFPLPLPGRHNGLNYLAGLAVAQVLGISWRNFSQGVKVTLPKGRSQQYALPNDILLLDETYNAGLESMLASLDFLHESGGQRHIAVLGTMKELGEKSHELHLRVGERAKSLNLDHVFVLVDDPEAQGIAEGAKGIPTDCYQQKSELIDALLDYIQSGDRILFKASNSVGLNEVVEQISVNSNQ